MKNVAYTHKHNPIVAATPSTLYSYPFGVSAFNYMYVWHAIATLKSKSNT